MSRVTLVFTPAGKKQVVKKVIKLPPTWESFASRVRSLTGITSFSMILEPSGGEVDPADFDVLCNNDVISIVQTVFVDDVVSTSVSPEATPRNQLPVSLSTSKTMLGMNSMSKISSLSVSPASASNSVLQLRLAGPVSTTTTTTTTGPPPPVATSTGDKGKDELHESSGSEAQLSSAPLTAREPSNGTMSLVQPSAAAATAATSATAASSSNGALTSTAAAAVGSSADSGKQPVRLPTRLDVHEGVSETGLYVGMMGVFWLTYHTELAPSLDTEGNSALKRKGSFATAWERSANELVRIPFEKPRSISCGHNSMAIIDAEGGLWMYGPADWPAACFGSTETAPLFLDSPMKISRVDIGFPTRMVACGAYFTVAEAEGGQIFSWGINSNLSTSGVKANEISLRVARNSCEEGGQLGRATKSLEEVEPGLITRTKRRCQSLSCGSSHTVLVTEDENNDEAVLSWGCNEELQCGMNREVEFVATPKFIRIGRNRPVKLVSCGAHHTVALLQDGRLFAWGWNNFGQLGRSSPLESMFPMEVVGVPRASMIACGESHSLMADLHCGELWSWGGNRFGELGRPEGNYLPQKLRFEPEPGDLRWTQVGACGYSSGALTASGKLFVWGFFKSANFGAHQAVPREISPPLVFVSQFGLGMCHIGLCCDETLGNVLSFINEFNGNPPVEKYKFIADLLARARGDVLHRVLNRGLARLDGDLPKIRCNVAYLVTNTQLLIVNFSQVLVSSASPFAVKVKIQIPSPDEVPSGCIVTIEPQEFRLSAGETRTVNVTVNVSKSVTQNVTTLMEMIVSRESFRFFRRKKQSEAVTKYFMVLAFPYTPLLNGRSGETSAYLMARFCAEGDMQAIKSLLDRGTDESTLELVNTRDYEGRTPLFVAAQSGHLNVVRLLVAKGAKVNVPDMQDITPLSAALSNGHDAVVKYLSSVGGSLDARRNGASEEELAFLRAANKLYIGARKQDLTALDQEDLLSLQAHLLHEIKQHAIPAAKLYAIEELSAPLTPKQDLAEKSAERISSNDVPESPPAPAVDAWKAASSWPSSGMAWILRCPESGGDWEPQLKQMIGAALSLGYAHAWKTGLLLQRTPDDLVALFWHRDPTGSGDWALYAVGRAKDGKSFGSIGLASMLVEDVLLKVWGNQLFEGIASVPAPAPLGAWESYFLCPECALPDFLGRPNPACLASAVVYEIVEMSTALAHAVVRCRSNHRLSLDRLAPFLLLEHLSSQRLSEEQLKIRLMIQTRVGAGGFSQIFKGTLVIDGQGGKLSGDPETEVVAVKQYIQRKPIMFSFDSPEERAAKEQEADQGALVVFRRLHHEVQMLSLTKFVTYESNPESEKDLERLLALKMFSLKPPYVMTDYYEFGDVYRVLHNNYTFPQLSTGWLIGVALDIARGMRFLHSCVPSLIHRDLKTPNVYIKSLNPNDPLRAVVGDLGTLVPMFSSHRSDAAPVTNPIWMAPELIARKPYNGSVDIYSFGIIMWELATREFPFTDLSSESLVDDKPVLRKAIAEEGLRPPIPATCVLGKEYAELMQQCWDQDPNRRPSFDTVVIELIKIKNEMAKSSAKE